MITNCTCRVDGTFECMLSLFKSSINTFTFGEERKKFVWVHPKIVIKVHNIKGIFLSSVSWNNAWNSGTKFDWNYWYKGIICGEQKRETPVFCRLIPVVQLPKDWKMNWRLCGTRIYSLVIIDMMYLAIDSGSFLVRIERNFLIILKKFEERQVLKNCWSRTSSVNTKLQTNSKICCRATSWRLFRFLAYRIKFFETCNRSRTTWHEA